MTLAFTFPGQGSQTVGMGRALAASYPEARAVMEEVDESLGQKLSRIMFVGPEAELTLTENAQPALMAVSLAVLRVLEARTGSALAGMACFVAGHSLGEYSALAAAGTFSLGDAARLLKIRGRAMQKAVPVGAGAMAALIGLDLAAAEAVATAAAGDRVCAVANDNAPGQVVVSGDTSAVERALELAAARGLRRGVPLPVSAPFHCRLMQPAAGVMARELAATAMRPPAVPLVANVTAAPVSEPKEIRQLLVRQVTARVRWRECVARMRAEGVDTLVELGAGRVLTGLARRIDRSLTAVSLGTQEEIEAFLET
ncbi:MAG: ACP S-malonyltransferase, partial [Alphaproteobacteria bacterium]